MAREQDLRSCSEVIPRVNRELRSAPGLLATTVVFEQRVGLALGLGPSQLRRVSQVRTDDAGVVLRFEQHVNGIPLWGRQIALRQDSTGAVTHAHGTVVQDLQRLEFLEQATLRKQAAVDQARRLASESKRESLLEARLARLVLHLTSQSEARLAYEVRLRPRYPVPSQTRPRVFVIGAHSGEVLESVEDLQTLTVNASRRGYSSAVYRKLYQLLARDAGWGAQATFGLFLRANLYYWTPQASPLAAARGVRDAARDLGLDDRTLVHAFSEVGIELESPPIPCSGWSA